MNETAVGKEVAFPSKGDMLKFLDNFQDTYPELMKKFFPKLHDFAGKKFQISDIVILLGVLVDKYSMETHVTLYSIDDVPIFVYNEIPNMVIADKGTKELFGAELKKELMLG